MTVALSQDSAGNTYQIWAQEQPDSCAIASMWMARCQAKQQTFVEEEWELAWRMYQRVVQGVPPGFLKPAPAPVCIDPNSPSLFNDQTTFYNMFGMAGTFAAQVVQALRNDGLKATHVVGSGNFQSLNLAKVSDSTPAVVLLGWYYMVNGALQRNGGHFVVAVNVLGNRIVYLDPWGGVLNEFGNNTRYDTNGYIEEIIYVSAA